MQYVLLYLENPEERAKGHDPVTADAYWGGWMAYMGAMSQAGVLQGGNGLDGPETATTLRIENGTRHVVDGPFADTKEAFGGYAVIEVPDLDTALEWAARAPCAAACSVEIRPVMPPPPAAA